MSLVADMPLIVDRMGPGIHKCPVNDDVFTKDGYEYCGKIRWYNMDDLYYLQNELGLECIVVRDLWLFVRRKK